MQDRYGYTKVQGGDFNMDDNQNGNPTPTPEPQAPTPNCTTCGNPAQAGNCSACNQNTMACTCPPASPDGGQGGPSSAPVV